MNAFRRLKLVHLFLDALLIGFSAYLSVFLKLGEIDFYPVFWAISPLISIFILIRIACFFAFGTYDIMWRYISFRDAIKMEQTILLSSVACVTTTYVIDLGKVPRPAFLIDAILVSFLLVGIRFARRLVYEKFSSHKTSPKGPRTIIYGAGENGRALAHRMMTDRNLNFQWLGFIDDSTEKAQRTVAGGKVLGTIHDLANILKKYNIQEVIISISKPSPTLLKNIIEILRPFNLQPRILRSSLEPATVNQTELFREIDLNDLLKRPKRKVDLECSRKQIEGRNVLITGAGGSIGSELARQILTFSPKKLLLLDHSEYNLFQIDRELRVTAEDSDRIIPILGNVRKSETLEQIMTEHSPEIIFHAAAYKHVHLAEKNPYATILNNIGGTLELLAIAEKFNVKNFVLISTDKAVNPAGIMGATKRVCELLVSEAAQLTRRRYCSVRFGNVLGSSGSLIPLLQKQILENKPLTITHKDMTRYFMLIPEAVALVLKATSIARPADICILNMGEPVKILDIAKNLTVLMGKSPDETPIHFTGVRPGEKISEELCLSGDELMTEHPDIFILPNGGLSPLQKDHTLLERVHQMLHHSSHWNKLAISELYALANSSSVQQESLSPLRTPDPVPAIARRVSFTSRLPVEHMSSALYSRTPFQN